MPVSQSILELFWTITIVIVQNNSKMDCDNLVTLYRVNNLVYSATKTDDLRHTIATLASDAWYVYMPGALRPDPAQRGNALCLGAALLRGFEGWGGVGSHPRVEGKMPTQVELPDYAPPLT